MKKIYENSKAYVSLDKKGNEFPIKGGLCQGDLRSPNFINYVQLEIFWKWNWEEKKKRMNGEYINNLRYADDVILIAKNGQQLQGMA